MVEANEAWGFFRLVVASKPWPSRRYDVMGGDGSGNSEGGAEREGRRASSWEEALGMGKG